MVETNKLFGAAVDKLLEAVVDKLPVVVVNKLKVDILAVNRLVAVLLAVVLKSGCGSGDQIPNGIGDCDLNLSKYTPYGLSKSSFHCLLWN
ncbi:hypothetical protein G9A89_019935 [Geosiphon pyriformis]|nr:hypothetical protein G9A89_019935 [Geosiphon pyriformis]